MPRRFQQRANASRQGQVLLMVSQRCRQRETAEAIVTDYHAAYVLAIKGSQPNLFNAVGARFTQPNSYFQQARRSSSSLRSTSAT